MALFHTTPLRLVAWDFDGVLNANEDRGTFRWAESFEDDIGHPLPDFVDSAILGPELQDTLTGKIDILDRITHWAAKVGYPGSAKDILHYWLSRDFHPDAEMQQICRALERKGLRQMIATNADTRRATWVEALRDNFAGVENVVASSAVGAAKPDPAYFAGLSEAADLPPGAILFVDDVSANVQAASNAGFRSFLLTQHSRDALKRTLGL